MKYYSSLLLTLLVSVAVFLQTGCQQPCDYGLPVLATSTDYCAPNFLDFDLTNRPMATEPVGLPASEVSSAAAKVLFTVRATALKEVFLHTYNSFLGKVTLEVYGSNCDSTDFEFIGRFDHDAIVNIDEFLVSGYAQMVIRASVWAQNSRDEPLILRPKDEISFALFSQAPEERLLRGDRVNPVTLDCQGRPNRIILTPGGDNGSVIEVAEALGLNIELCKCDENLAAVIIPNGISLDKLSKKNKPKVPESSVEPDTTKGSFDLLIDVPETERAKIGFQWENDFDIPDDESLLQPTNEGGNGLLKVALIDSGADLLNTPFLNDYKSKPVNDPCALGELGYDFINDKQNPDDEVGHGTSVASTFVGGLDIRGRLMLSHLKFFGNQGGMKTGTLFDALCATSSAIKNDYDIINMSWGFQYGGLPNAMNYVFSEAEKQDVILVASAGNLGQNTLDLSGTSNQYFPAAAAAGGRFPNLVVVGSYTAETGGGPLLRAPFSNYNPEEVDLAANFGVYCYQKGGAVEASFGTSISAPMATQAIAEILMQQGSNRNPAKALEIFRFGLKKVPSLDTTFVAGRILPMRKVP